ncbi:MAG: hypothetical protein ACK5V0_06650 [Alphaproteobacteria bacterium]|jgi:hypothetical protein|nr:hypothetical protein [Rubrivivax sp.]
MSAATDPATPTLRVPMTGFVVAWAVFWLLMLLMELQDAQRSGVGQAWRPWLWMLSSCAVATVLAWLHWRQVPRLDGAHRNFKRSGL